MRDTLIMLKERGTRLVLGLRDVMDDPASLLDEWRRKNVYPALYELYDEIWVYGLPQIFNPLTELPGMLPLAHKVTFTGYLRRSLPSAPPNAGEHELPGEPYILVTTGGGGDGEALIDWVLRAYETDPDIPHPALVVFGPFMHLERRREFQERARAARQGLRDHLRDPFRAAAWSARSAWSRWAATTPSARSSRSASRRCWCRAPSRGRSSCCAPSAPPSWAWSSVLADDGVRSPAGHGRAPARAARLAAAGGGDATRSCWPGSSGSPSAAGPGSPSREPPRASRSFG